MSDLSRQPVIVSAARTPIGRFLGGASREEGEAALGGTLNTPAARERSNDDKTLVWAQAVR